MKWKASYKGSYLTVSSVSAWTFKFKTIYKMITTMHSKMHTKLLYVHCY